jgi:predicted  nucleic acid-binding Zn-ribbon protein
VTEAQKRLTDTTGQIETLAKTRRAKEQDLASQEDRIQKLRTRQGEIKTNKEYQAHIQEIEAAKTQKTKLEDELLALMEQTETLQSQIGQIQAALQTAEAEFAAEKQRLETENAGEAQELAALEQERTVRAAAVEPDILKQYDRLRASRKDLAVVAIVQGSCTGCHMSVPPQLAAEVKRQDRLLTCSSCQRILYWPVPTELRPAEPAKQSQ